MNKNFENAIKNIPQNVPPIWFMRQAGRYHSHYQNLKKNYTFEELCKTPELAAEVAFGPIDDFDYDVAILFSDILFPLELLGLDLSYNPGPTFSNYLTPASSNLKVTSDYVHEKLSFQAEAVSLTKRILPSNKSFVGFVGGPWTILSYGLNYKNKSTVSLEQDEAFIEKILYDIMMPLLRENIAMQLDAGAEYIYIFDTNSSQLNSSYFKNKYLESLKSQLFHPFNEKIAYFSKNIEVFNNIQNNINSLGLAGLVYPESTGFLNNLKNNNGGFIQGNFSPKSLLKPHKMFIEDFNNFIEQMKTLDQKQRSGWVCSLNHGVLPKTPEENVRYFIETIRSVFSGNS